MRKKVLLIMLGLAFTTLLTACGGSNNQELEGTWRTVTFFIDENQEINYLGSEITFTATQLTHEDHVASWEISEDENFLLIDSGHFFGSQRFELTGDILELDAFLTFFRVGSSAYDEERERVEAEANTLLGYLEELSTTRDEFDNAVLDAESRIEQEIMSWLDGTWVFLNSFDDMVEAIEVTFNGDQVTYSVESIEGFLFEEEIIAGEGALRIDLNLRIQANVTMSQIDNIQQSSLPQINDITEAIEELEIAITLLGDLSIGDLTSDSLHTWTIRFYDADYGMYLVNQSLNEDFIVLEDTWFNLRTVLERP